MNEQLNDHTIALLRESFDLIEPIAPQAGEMFYANLFEADPSLRLSFDGDLREQGAALMQMIALAVARLDDPALLVPTLQALGQRQSALGLRSQHPDATRAATRAALLKTLYQCLGAAYNDEVEAAWVEAHALAVDSLKDAAGVPA